VKQLNVFKCIKCRLKSAGPIIKPNEISNVQTEHTNEKENEKK